MLIDNELEPAELSCSSPGMNWEEIAKQEW